MPSLYKTSTGAWAVSDVRDGIPRASRPFESPMTLAIRNSRATVAPDPSLVAAGADEAEADTAQRIAAYPSVIDAERHPLYGHGVECHCKTARLDPDEVTRWGEPYARMLACTRERDRLGRLSRWQEQR